MPNAAVLAPVSKSQITLLDKLREMFPLDRGDLDFGIYRIMNFRQAEIGAYLARELPAQVRDLLEAADLKRQLDQKVAQARGFDLDPDTIWVNGDNNLQNLRLTSDDEEDEDGEAAGEGSPSEDAAEALS